MDKGEVQLLMIGWLVMAAIIYPALYVDYIFKNPAFVMPNLQELMQLFGNQSDRAVSQFLTNTASYIEMGWSLEHAASHALPQQKTSTIREDMRWANRAMEIMSDDTKTFDSALLSLGLIANSRKYDLTARFLKEARESRYASMAETLKILSDTFWSSHMTVQHYQANLLWPVVGSFGLKFIFMFILSVMFPALWFFLIMILVVDAILMLFCMA